MNKKYLISIIIVVILLTGCSFDDRMNSAERSISEGNYKKAEKELMTLKDKNKENKKIYDLLIDLYEKTGKDIKNILLEGIENFNNIEYKKKLGEIYIEENNFKDALEIYEDIVSEEKDIREFKRLFYIYRQLGMNTELLLTFESNIDYIKERESLLEIALLYVDLGNEERGRSIVENLDLENIRDLKEFELLAEYYFKINDDEKSYEVVRRGLGLYDEESILHGYNYGFMNSDGLKMLEIYSEDVNGDGYSENIILLANSKNLLESNNIILTVQDAKTGDILGKKRLTSYLGYQDIKFMDFDKDKIKDIYLDSYIDKGVHGKPEIFSFVNNDFKLLTNDYVYNDIEYLVSDNFIVDIYSGYLNKKYIVDLKKDEKKYRDMNIFDENGKIIDSEQIYLSDSSYEPVFLEKENSYGIKEKYSLTIDSESIADLELIYAYKDDLMDIYDFSLDTEYRSRIGKYTGDKVTLIDDLDLKQLKEILGMDKKTIYKLYGKPTKVDYLHMERLDYNGIQFFLSSSDKIVESIRILNSKNVLDMTIPGSYKDIISKMGKADYENISSEYIDEYEMVYLIDGVKLIFSGNKEREGSFILVVESE